ncbi:MAG: hypothetical protein JNK05_06935 [Myxococcales bacterium]|nr:hypothetical protein [Myxococcales bacterium]
MKSTRRELLQWLQNWAALAGVVAIAPAAVGCGTSNANADNGANGGASGAGASSGGAAGQAAAGASNGEIPKAKPASWDPIAFNRDRGNAGAIPESYRAQINGADGATAHLGKHLPYVPEMPAGAVAAGMLAIMWGDPAKGHAKHPNAAPSESNPTGHWYNWIRVRKATDAEAQEAESRFSSWPAAGSGDNGRYAAREGTDPAADAGKNTVYLVALPSDVQPGDTVRVHAHCLTHGEYVDFVTIPAR